MSRIFHLVKPAFVGALVLAFSWISASAQYTLGGNASSLGSGCYRLTPASNSQAGYVYQNAAVSLADTLDLKFSVYLGTNNAGADGIVFVMRGTLASPYIGTGGGGMGYLGTPFTNNSLGIEMDTYQNSIPYNDPTNDHIAIHKNGNVDHLAANNLAGPVNAVTTGANIEDGQYHVFNVRWNPSTQIIEVYFDCEIRLSDTVDLINTVFGSDTLVHWGFVGSTGGAANDQRFCLTSGISNFVTLATDTQICIGDTAHLNAGQSQVTYNWSPSLGLSAFNIANPDAYPNTTTTYTITKSYLCDTLFDTVTVSINEPDFSVSAIITNTSCKDVCDGEIDAEVVNGTGMHTWAWSTTDLTEDINGLCNGTYVVTVQDTMSTSPDYLCYMSDTFYVTEPNLLTTNIFFSTNTQCPNSTNCDAEATAATAGGTAPYAYEWSNGELDNNAYALCAGMQYITVTDTQGCTAVDSVEIFVPDEIVTVAFDDTLVCVNKIASLAAFSTGGTAPYSYVWHQGSLTGPVVSISAVDVVQPANTTTYFVQSFDANGCTGDSSKVLVKVRPPLSVAFVSDDTICPYDTIVLRANGIGGDSLYSYNWAVGGFGPTVSVSPDVTSYFKVTVSDFCGSPFYVDSVKVQVGGFNAIVPNIRVEDDSLCAGESIYMIAAAVGGFNGPDEYVYTWQHNGSNNNVQFDTPTETTRYIVKIEDLCLSPAGYDTVFIYVGEPSFPEVTVFPEKVCAFSDFTIRIDEYNPKYTYQWLVDDIEVFENYEFDSLVYRLSNPGCYDFDLSVITDFGCPDRFVFDCAMEVLQSPVAAFNHSPENPSNLQPFVDFTSLTDSIEYAAWHIDGDTFVNVSRLQYEFAASDEPYNIRYVVAADNGCTDTAEVALTYYDETVIRYPNSFSPNGDGLNDEFFILAEGVELADFDLSIFDRWGNQVFRSNRMTRGWDGRLGTGEMVSTGVYFFTLQYRDFQNKKRTLSDHLTVINPGAAIGLK